MRIVLQRVVQASVRTEDTVLGAIGPGFCLLVGFTERDTETEVRWMAEKVAGLRVFSDEAGKMNRSLDEVNGGVLVVSQFTLYGDAEKGRRPSFIRAARPETAVRLYEAFIRALRDRGLEVATGSFGAMMRVSIENDGPVTLLLERDAPEP